MGLPGQAPKHDADHGETHEGSGGSSVALEVAGQAAVSADPGEAALDDPALGQDHEVMSLAAFDDFQGPTSRIGGRLCRLGPLVAGVGKDPLDEGEAGSGLAQNLAQAIAILDVGRMDDDAQQEAERIDEDVPLATRDLLARIKALRVERGAPF